MSWVPVVLLGVAAFLAGGVWSFRSQQRPAAAWVLAVLAAMCVAGAFLWAWEPQ